MSLGRRVLQLGLPLMLAGGTVAGVVLLKQFAPPPAEAKEEVRLAPVVDTASVRFQDHPFTIASQGVALSVSQTRLTSEVSGRVISLSPQFIAGGLVRKGEVLVTIERGDYESALRSAEASLAHAEANLTEERARSQVAEAEWKTRGLSKATDLALRKPQLAREEANVVAAKADLERAKRNLARTEIRAPFDALIASRDIEPGQSAAVGSALGELHDVSMAEVRLPLLRSELMLLDLPGLGEQRPPEQLPAVTLTVEAGDSRLQWQGVIGRSESLINESNRMLYVVAQVRDPYGLSRASQPENSSASPLHFGSFVEAEIQAPALQQVARVPRELLRPDSTLALVSELQQIELREVTPVRQDARFIYLRDQLQSGEQLVLSPLDRAYNGMPVSVSNPLQPLTDEMPGAKPGTQLAELTEPESGVSKGKG